MALPDQPPDPHGTLAWVNAVFETIKGAYQALIVPTAIGAAWVVRRWDTRRDNAKEQAVRQRASEEEAHQRIADQLDRESAERFELIRRENGDLRADKVRLQDENDRLIGLVRRWFDRAHNMRHDAERALQLTFGALERAGQHPPEVKLPALSHNIDAP